VNQCLKGGWSAWKYYVFLWLSFIEDVSLVINNAFVFTCISQLLWVTEMHMSLRCSWSNVHICICDVWGFCVVFVPYIIYQIVSVVMFICERFLSMLRCERVFDMQWVMVLCDISLFASVPKRKLPFPGHPISWVSDWVIDWLIDWERSFIPRACNNGDHERNEILHKGSLGVRMLPERRIHA